MLGQASFAIHNDDGLRHRVEHRLKLKLVLGGLLLVYELKKTSELQDCVMQGRTNCAPVDAANSAD